jgi:mono/diheme cytochrome c family protein
MKLKFFLLMLSFTLSHNAFTQEIDETSGLIKNTGWELVNANCSACHSIKLVTSNRGNKDEWLSTIRWMQATQKLWQFDPTTEDIILTYLAENYPAIRSNRRQSIPENLMPQ